MLRNCLQTRADIAASFQRVAVAQLEQRVRRGITWARDLSPDVSCLVVSGGVAANATLRARLDAVASAAELPAVHPPPRLCTDNGALERASRPVLMTPVQVPGARLHRYHGTGGTHSLPAPRCAGAMVPQHRSSWQTQNIGTSPRTPNNRIISGAVHGLI